MQLSTLDDAKLLIRKLRHRDRVRLVPRLVASFDSTGAERQSGYEAPPDGPEAHRRDDT